MLTPFCRSFIRTDCWQSWIFLTLMRFLFPPPVPVVASPSLPWLMLIKPRSCCFRGEHMGASHLFSPCSDLSLQVRVFVFFCVSRVISSLQRQLVTADFTPEFREKLQDFYRRLPLPVELKNLRNRCVLVRALHGNSVSLSVTSVADGRRNAFGSLCFVPLSACVSVPGTIFCW